MEQFKNGFPPDWRTCFKKELKRLRRQDLSKKAAEFTSKLNYIFPEAVSSIDTNLDHIHQNLQAKYGDSREDHIIDICSSPHTREEVEDQEVEKSNRKVCIDVDYETLKPIRFSSETKHIKVLNIIDCKRSRTRTNPDRYEVLRKNN